ncbi:MAG TPA: 3-hydroxyacyl-CoA dehydrogenase NAD-binding domain-containing protein [Myxococcota bacterium]
MSKIEILGVIGAGQMGRGIAQVAAQAGCQVPLLDAWPELAEAGRKEPERAAARLVVRGKLESRGERRGW